MPSSKVKCGLCNGNLLKSQPSIQCKMCKLWNHLPCADVSDEHLALFLERPNAFSFTCETCSNDDDDNKPLRDEVRALKNSFDDFVKAGKDELSSFKDVMAQVMSDFKTEVSTCIKEMKTDIVACSKLINNIDSSVTSKISSLELENHVLHRRLNRTDVVINGLPSGLTDLKPSVISLCSFYGLDISEFNLNNVCYMSKQKRILVKFNKVELRDRLMQEYFKNKALQVKDILGGDIESRVFLNDHYSPSASNMNFLCRKLLHQKVIMKYRILNNDHLKAKITLCDGKEVLYDVGEIVKLLDTSSRAKK